MAELNLYFTPGASPELEKVCFSHPFLAESRICVRGKSGTVFGSPYSFQWTQAVRALCVFFLKNSARRSFFDRQQKTPTLSGARNTIAASLDYALSKQPSWLLDMFGTDKRGRSLARRFIHRANPEMKRPGPVVLSLNDKALSPSKITIHIGQRIVTRSQELLSLARHIEYGDPFNSSHGMLIRSQNFEHSHPTLQSVEKRETINEQVVHNLLFDEVSEMLWKTDIFSSSYLKKTNERLRSNPSVVKRIGDSAQFVDDVDLSLSSAERLGMGIQPELLKKNINRDEPLRVVCPWMMPGALALFEYLKTVKGFHLEIDYEWGYTAEVRRAVTNGYFDVAPDLFVLGVAPAATAIGQDAGMPYRPLMFVPSISHRVLMSQTAFDHEVCSLSYGEYQFLYEEASTPEFCFENLERSKFVDRKTVQISHLEPDEATNALAQGDPNLKMIMFFPHYPINELFNGCRAVRFPDEEMGLQEGILFAHESLVDDRSRLRCLDVAIRNAWLELRNSPDKLSSLIEEIVAEKRFVEFLFRFTGMHNLPTIHAT